MATYTDSKGRKVTVSAALVGKIIDGHAVVIDDERVTLDVTCLAYVCVECESVAMCSAPEDVAPMRANFDLACCAPETTIYPTF